MLPVVRRHIAASIPSWLSSFPAAGGSLTLSHVAEAFHSHESNAHRLHLDSTGKPVSSWRACHAEHSCNYRRQRPCFQSRMFASQPEQPQGPGSHHGAETSQEPPLPTQDVEYHGPLSKTHSLLKRISIANTSLALAAAPAIVLYADASLTTRIGLAISLAMFGVMTTGGAISRYQMCTRCPGTGLWQLLWPRTSITTSMCTAFQRRTY
ncbi:hypothetical protein DUNSADRAFT_14070 [Dunaliella salina]|uniref:Uncharacterized protein n=1 Tax=Dunaliella salina TaxID=3046 RepID=A0ABQ7G844_DUNSA|nr:hypothetical protein DUNSADRAFT_14070 [Dunaliella salina]|eukprot:KAF5830768.1 hypothetical protein DUNSADRAFT_14070 [Dunaliella salina]